MDPFSPADRLLDRYGAQTPEQRAEGRAALEAYIRALIAIRRRLREEAELGNGRRTMDEAPREPSPL